MANVISATPGAANWLYRPSDLVVDTQVGEETVLLHLESGMYFGLNPLSARIWEHLKSDTDAETICSVIAGEYDEPVGKVQNDVRNFLSDMLESGLLIKAC